MSTISAEREQEYGVPYGDYSINADMNYINSDEFAKKFKNITENKAVNETLLQCARNAIAHRNGTLYEDMYLINGDTGEIMARRLDMTAKQGISHNDEIDNAILTALEKNIPIIAFHSHPEGYPPSVDDLMPLMITDILLQLLLDIMGRFIFTQMKSVHLIILKTFKYISSLRMKADMMLIEPILKLTMKSGLLIE